MAISTIGNLTLDELIASPKAPIFTHKVTLTGTAAATLGRGQLIGKTTVTSEGTTTTTYGAYVAGANTIAYAILADNVVFGDGGTVDAVVYVSGHFNGNKVTSYAAGLYDQLRSLGIYVDKAMAY